MRRTLGAALAIALACSSAGMIEVPAARSDDSSPTYLGGYPEGLSERDVRLYERAAKKKKAKRNKKSKTPGAVNFNQKCRKVVPLKIALLKNAYPGHISLSDPRASGFAFVMSARGRAPKFPAPVYYRNGELAFRLGYYGRWEGNGQARAYCGAGGVPRCHVSAVSRKARSLDGNIYIDFGNGTCHRARPGVRNGST